MINFFHDKISFFTDSEDSDDDEYNHGTVSKELFILKCCINMIDYIICLFDRPYSDTSNKHSIIKSTFTLTNNCLSQKCTICLSIIDKQHIVTECNHHFHTECFIKWFNKETSCPICRRSTLKTITHIQY